MRAIPALLLTVLALALPLQAGAQGLFSAAITVNDRAITGYELDQRARLLGILGAPGNPRDEARKQLIEERLKLDAAEANGLRLSDEQIEAGMQEFAARSDQSLEAFLRGLAANGVARQSLRDFVEAGLVWRELVRARFGPRAQVTEDEVDRALAATSGTGGVRVLLSEIIMPAPPQLAAEVQARAERISRIRSIAAFAAEAREYSATASRERGGRLDWLSISELPPALRGVILGLQPGEVTDPLTIPNAIALFQLRAIQETDTPDPTYAAIDYAAFYIPGGRSEAALGEARDIAARIDTCDDLYGVARGLPAERLDRDVLPPDQIPDDIAIELAKLDEGEVSMALTRAEGETLVLLMLCGRTNAVNDDTDRAAVSARLRNDKLASFADSYLAELQADALIVER